MLGSYLCVGFVAENHRIACYATKLLQQISQSIINAKVVYPTTEDYSEWKENVISIKYDEAVHKCIKHSMARIELNYSYKGRVYTDIMIMLECVNKRSSLTFFIPENNLDYPMKMDYIEHEIVALMLELLPIGFSFAFCDSEAELETCYGKSIETEDIYSIVVYPHDEALVVRQSPWRIDGLTQRI